MHGLRSFVGGLLPLVSCALLLTLAAPVQAGIFCIRNAAEMRNALDAAGENGENDQVRVRAGYLQNDGQQFTVTIEPNFSLNILGGWYGPNSQCDFVDPRPQATVVDGMGLPNSVFGIFSQNGDVSGSFYLYNMTVMGGVAQDANGGCVRLIGRNGTTKINVERVILTGCSAVTAFPPSMGGAFYIFNNGSATIRVSNSLIYGNSADTAAVALIQQNAAGTISLSNNTIVNNVASQAGSDAAALSIANLAGSAGTIQLANNIFLGNTSAQQQEIRYSSVPGPSYLTLRNNALVMPVNGTVLSESGTLAMSAALIDTMHFMPKRNSLLINAGTASVTAGLGSVDLYAHTRDYGGAPDIGAVEADAEYLLMDSFD